MNTHQTVDALKALFKVASVDLRVGDTEVCKDLSFEAYPGEMIAILGCNGVGKSTLLSCLAGLPRGRFEGNVSLGGKSYTEWGDRAAACWRGWLPQMQLDSFSASAFETVLAGRHPHLNRWSWESPEDKALAIDSLNAVGMADFANRDVMTLSGGERQRVAIATILAQNPSLYFMDEPLSHLDLYHQVEVLRLMRTKSIKERVSCIMVLHEPGLAHRYCDSALLLYGKGEWEYGSCDTVLTEKNLSRLYGYPLAQVERTDAQGLKQRWFVPS
jgi:iron complex transport system ATP-binding protein